MTYEGPKDGRFDFVKADKLEAFYAQLRPFHGADGYGLPGVAFDDIHHPDPSLHLNPEVAAAMEELHANAKPFHGKYHLPTYAIAGAVSVEGASDA